MTKPFLLVQLSDPHIGATWMNRDPAALRQAAIKSVADLPDRPDAVLVSGDLVEHGTDDEYVVVKSALDTLDAPTFVLPGNHDDRGRLREHFGVPRHARRTGGLRRRDSGPVRLVVLDSTEPGADLGELGERQLDWLEAELSASPGQEHCSPCTTRRSPPECRPGT